MYQTIQVQVIPATVPIAPLKWRLAEVKESVEALVKILQRITTNGHAVAPPAPAPTVVHERVVFLRPGNGDWDRPILNPGAGSRGGAPSKPDLGRVSFMRGQKSVEEHIGLPAFGYGGRQYNAYMFRKASGQLVIVVEADMTNNAVLVLRWHKAWRKTIQLTKGRLYGPRRSRRHPMVMRVIRHVGDWQDQIRHLVS